MVAVLLAAVPTAVTDPALVTVKSAVSLLVQVKPVETVEPPTVVAVAVTVALSPATAGGPVCAAFRMSAVGLTVTDWMELSETQKSEHPAQSRISGSTANNVSVRRTTGRPSGDMSSSKAPLYCFLAPGE